MMQSNRTEIEGQILLGSEIFLLPSEAGKNNFKPDLTKQKSINKACEPCCASEN